MTIPAILGHGAFLMALTFAAFARPARRRHPRLGRGFFARHLAKSESHPRVPLDRLPDSSSLAGVPLRVLLSDRSGPGALLRDTLLTRPYKRQL